ncbi:hypothetical protein CVT24_009204 [Panaeolus cyanescens]|uniref:SAC3/GANP/THP3 conserved domain-containing protein n=1 Tax=Panaeolus cyanescens TaxID=181874 RepID=A0A409Y8W9_9AGAR|nr:hypothetical protein CVT24_009204 [Panaeolus cyanescens]
MDGPSYPRGGRGRGTSPSRGRGRPHSRNNFWTGDGPRTNPPAHSDGERWERGGHRARGRGRGGRGVKRGYPNMTLRGNHLQKSGGHQIYEPIAVTNEVEMSDQEYEEPEVQEPIEGEEEEVQLEDDPVLPRFPRIEEPELETAEERERFYQELVKAREVERKKAIAEGKMDDPLVPKRLEDAICIVGTCMDMCPRFERYRRERENNLFEWETIPGTKRVDHNRAVKMYERAAGDKTIPSDLRPPIVLKRTLDYLFHDLLLRGGFSATCSFIRDRSRSVRNDFTMQHITGPLAIECHDRCARFHILVLHFERDKPHFSIPMEEQQLMNTLQSLKEFYMDQRGKYQSRTELEMRVYHRLIHIRDQRERHDDIPQHILNNPVFKLTTQFREHVQKQSAPISKVSKLVVGPEGMQIFGQLASILMQEGNKIMAYLVACILERLFGKETIDDIESIRGELTIPEIIDGMVQRHLRPAQVAQTAAHIEEVEDGMEDEDYYEGEEEHYEEEQAEAQIPQAPQPVQPSVLGWFGNALEAKAPQASEASVPVPASTSAFPSISNSITPVPSIAQSAFANLVSTPNPFGNNTNIFGGSSFTVSNPVSAFGSNTSVFGQPAAQPSVPAAAPLSNPAIPSAPATATSSQDQVNGASRAAPSTSVFTSVFSAQPPSAPAPVNPFQQPTFKGESTQSLSSPPKPQINGSIFGNPFATTTSTPPSLNPKAPSFVPSPASSSLFSTAPSKQESPQSDKKEPAPVPSLPTATSSIFGSPFGVAPKPTTSPIPQPTPVTAPPFSLLSKPTPPSTTPTPPPTTTRLVAPPLLKIDTNTSSSSTASAIDSPKVPPPLTRQQPVALPETPRTVLQPPNALLGHLRSSLGSMESVTSPGTSGSQEILSPLTLGTPTNASFKPLNNFTPLSTPSTSRRFSGFTPPTPPVPPVTTNGKGKAPEVKYTSEQVEELKAKALSFAQKGQLVKKFYKKWMYRTMDRAAYHEACRQSEKYHNKLQSSQSSRNGSLRLGSVSRPGTPADRKRRISMNASTSTDPSVSPQKKRARKRVSREYKPPQTDEELAQRFKENREEHEKRWAPGSFLQVIRQHAKRLSPQVLKLPWHLWLSLNPDSDATAIWLERKFDMPDSGTWFSEAVFSIPLSSAGGSKTSNYPGLIAFECTPLGDAGDELEKKYRILDDCSRLRELMQSLPPKRHFIPSLLVICWAEGSDMALTTDFFDMIKKFIQDGVLQSSQTFSITAATKELDTKLETTLSGLTLDVQGKRVQTLPARGVFKLFEATFNVYINEWVENCDMHGRFHWGLMGQVFEVAVAILNNLMSRIQTLMEVKEPIQHLPEFNGGQIVDSETAYDDAAEWLSGLISRDDARLVAMDLQSHRNISQDFPARIFLEHLYELAQAQFERQLPQASRTPQVILNSDIKDNTTSYEKFVGKQQLRLFQILNFSSRRSPKRRNESLATSQQSSPIANKKPRLSDSIISTSIDEQSTPSSPPLNGRASPAPTDTTANGSPAPASRPAVTVAMLRALTRDMKKKYMT